MSIEQSEVGDVSNSSSYELVYHPSDVAALPPSLTKEQTRENALNRLSEFRLQINELRSAVSTLQKDKDELRQIIQLLQEKVNAERLDRSSVTEDQQPQPIQQPAVDAEQAIRPYQVKTAQPEKFNGIDKIPTISNWLAAMRRYLRLTRTDANEYIDVAATFFTGTALDWWNNIEKTEGDSVYIMTWSEFEGRCTRRFQAVNDAQLAFQRLLRWRQTGNITSYLAGFQSLVQQVPTRLLTEDARVLLLIEGLNRELQKSVKLMQPATLDEAIGVAQRASAISQPAGQFTQSFSRQPYHQASTTTRSSSQLSRTASGNRFAALTVENIEDVRPPSIEDTDYLSQEGENAANELQVSYLTAEQKQLYKEKKCFKCKRFGHFGKDCRSTTGSTKE
jgi:hypothetical protein